MLSFLAKPKEVVKGTSMAFPGFKKEKDRVDVVAYLSTLKDFKERWSFPPAKDPLLSAATPPPARYDFAINLLMLISFMDATEYSVVMPSLWNYLNEVEPSDTRHGLANEYGIVIASFSLASLLLKPLVGIWCDQRSFKEVYAVTLLAAAAGNALYAFAGLGGSWLFMLAGRLLSGAGAANSSLSFAYVSRTVEPSSRTGTMAKLSLAFPLGMVVGPAFNALLAQLHATLPLPGGATLRVNPNNSPGLLMAALVLLQLVALLTLLPEPPPYTSDPAAPPGRKCDAAKGVLRELRSLPVLACFTATFTFNLTIATSEALVVPVTKAAFGFSALQNSFVYLAIAVLMIGLNLAALELERGLVSLLASSPASADATAAWSTRAARLAANLEADEAVGRSDVKALERFCGVAYVLLVWRYDMPLYAFLLGELLLLWNIPFVFAPNRSVFSKLVEGSKHQALLSSLLSIAASAGGVVGPIWLGASVGEPSIRRTSRGEEEYGPVAQVTFVGLAGCVLLCATVYAAAGCRFGRDAAATVEPLHAVSRGAHDDVDAAAVPGAETGGA
ncbi:hypothetical protein EMIHUDRAFT_217667 [Emiliania huxleyi CCMP1516]|uniref:Major facilitator superfamily (MFS) profile domain-containing protein n=2 Tax=Emiliania huxleyi TaxID=2903 RepID=A0A0D3IA35_EMIH1|nr:hypothetical protein EMIHUDRAFT_217667 [Emiliania huxleyi CCMP1516]EOD08120.1 hypothetical protein EMIHUDRAFT_217667 [Emiliania huxleyi CCMP1516]|eukprot:XP_005760549.1 hypothetical protein EMIHUDRAFT_217667 [Emiliania huxleyi CCMP1516]